MAAAVLTLVGLVLLGLVGVIVPVVLRIRGTVALVVAGLVVAGAEVVLITISLSLVELYRPGWMLAGEAFVAMLALLAWARAGRPPLVGRRDLPSRAAIIRVARAHPGAVGMAGVAVAALAVQFLVGLATAPSNWDSMSYHLARIAFWLQFDSALHWHNGTISQLNHPPNAEMLQGWTMLLSGGDRLVASVQWLALVGLAATTLMGSRELGFGRAQAVFAAALFVVLPQPILQAVTTQNDLITAFFVVAAVLFGLRGLRDRTLGDLVVFALALGVAAGAKGTALFALPWVGLVLVVTIWRTRPGFGLVLRGAAITVVALVALGSFNYVLNQHDSGNPFGGVRKETDRISPLGANTVRGAWSFVDTPGIDVEWFNIAVERPALRFFGDLATERFPGFRADSGVNEDTSSYGALGMLALLLFAVVAVAPKTRWDRRVVALAALGYIATFLVINEQNPFVARLMMPGMAIGAPLLAYLHVRGPLRGMAVALAVLGLVPALFVNELRPLVAEIGAPSILQRERLEQQTLNRPEMAVVLTKIDDAVPRDAPLGLVHGGDSWDYLLFGPRLERRVMPVTTEEASYETMREKGLRGIVFLNAEPPEGLDAQPLVKGYGDYFFAPAR